MNFSTPASIARTLLVILLLTAGFLQVSASTYHQNIVNQQRPITGTVTDEKGEALAGVTVKNKKTNATVTTDKNGKYTIKIDEHTDLKNRILIVSENTPKISHSEFDYSGAQELNVLSLAPSGKPGRLVIYTDGALAKLKSR